jgi:hypothetical protein
MQNKIKATLTHHGCYGGVVTVRYENNDEVVSFVSYAAVGDEFVITSFGVNPQATAKEAQASGDAIDSVLEAEAYKYGIKRLLIVQPNQNKADFVREYPIQPFTIGAGVKANPLAYLN